VDEAVAPLVEALNLRADLVTLDSCQGDDEQDAYVIFAAVGSDLRAVLADITRRLSGLTVRGVPVRVRLDQNLTEGTEIAELIVPLNTIREVAEALSGSVPAV
jgi:hypothetical protein